MSSTAIIISFFFLVFYVQVCQSITVADLYTRLLEKNRKVEDTFAFQFVRPIGSVAGEYIWPRSYSTSSEIIFDENGAAYNVHQRPKLFEILQRTRTSSLRSNARYDDESNYYNSRR